MANLNEKTYATKLRGTDTSKFRSMQYRSHSNSHLQPYCLLSDTTHISEKIATNQDFPTLIDEPNKKKCGGRGMAIAQMSQTSMTSNINNLTIKNYNPEYSNLSIEQYFKKRKEENFRKTQEKNESTWKKMLHSTNNS